jgi:FkbM family methyltransferase
VYEPEVWQSLMSEVRLGDTVVDIGAFIGLYTLALGRRVGKEGKVVAFEPDSNSFLALQEHIALNHLEDRIRPIRAAVGAITETVSFDAAGITGHVTTLATSTNSPVECVTLDSVFLEERLDILKIDVEGYEERVLRGRRKSLATNDADHE